MKFTSVLVSSIVFATGALSKSVECVVHDFNVIGEEIRALTCEIQAFEHHGAILHDIAPLINIQRDVKDLESIVEDTNDDVRDLCPLNDQQTLQLAEPLLQLVKPIVNLIHAVENKRCAFDHAIVHHISASPLVKGDLKVLKVLVEELVALLRCKVSESYVSLLETQAAEIFAAFDHAICVTYRHTHCIDH